MTAEQVDTAETVGQPSGDAPAGAVGRQRTESAQSGSPTATEEQSGTGQAGGGPSGDAPDGPADGQTTASVSDRAALVAARAAIAAAVLAGVGLVASGISTFYAARVAQAQVDQINQQMRNEESKNASKVALWSQKDKDRGPSEIHIANRSQETFYDAQLIIQIDIDEPNGDRYVVVHQFTFMPCTEIAISLDRLKAAPKGTMNDFPGTKMLDTGLAIPEFSIDFQDADGIHWFKSPTSLSRQIPKSFPYPNDAADKGHVTTVAWQDLGPTTPVPGCGQQADKDD
ncbi:hypothetical protein [Kitasatospora sp. NPDC004531]